MIAQITWTDQAKNSLRDIYNYYKTVSVQGAKNVRNDIANAPKTIRYPKQYQIDGVHPKYRRIVVRKDYKILYTEKNNSIYIIDIVSTKQLLR